MNSLKKIKKKTEMVKTAKSNNHKAQSWHYGIERKALESFFYDSICLSLIRDA